MHRKMPPPHLVAQFDQAYQANAEALDKMVEAHREYMNSGEYDRMTSLLAQVDCARLMPDQAHHVLAVAVDRLAKMRNAADQLAAVRDE